MNCEKCQELLSDFLDGTLKGREQAQLTAHLDECLECAGARYELTALISAAQEAREQLFDPPNERALWLRIRNTIEGDEQFGRAAAYAARPARVGLWARLLSKRWELSLPQAVAAVAAIAVSVSLMTTIGLQRLASAPAAAETAAADAIERHSAALVEGYPQTFLEPHMASINYWQQRVEQRKASWNPRMRASFDRSLGVLDETVNESIGDLRQNPHDEVAEEMLNSALRDKIELLREFGEQ